jgi:hypothetical protein
VTIVPRPLFIEEFGLKRLMDSSAIPSVCLDRTAFEAGEWEDQIEVAYERGRLIKDTIRRGDSHPAQTFTKQNGGEVIVEEILKFMINRSTLD